MTVGLTDPVPLVAPPVEKFTLVVEVAFVQDHVSVEDEPLLIVVGLAERLQVGRGCVTVTVTD